jgi:signal transduction histidine kinase/FixJ family two-component response regulator
MPFKAFIPHDIAVATLAIQALVAGQMFLIARAPGWRRAGVFGGVAQTAALYSVVYALGTAQRNSLEVQAIHMALNVAIGSLHASAWAWFAWAPDARRWRDLPVWLQRVMAVTTLFVVGVCASGQAVSLVDPVRMQLPSVGYDHLQPTLSGAGILSLVIMAVTYVAALIGLWQRRREQGGTLVLVGYVMFIVFVSLEALIAAFGLQMMYPAPLGLLAAIVPVAVQMQGRFTADAERLAWLSSSLQGQLVSRTEERDVARSALLRQEQVASIGRLANGLAHELSNPLQHVTIALDELRHLPVAAAGTEGRLIRDIGHGVERMEDVVHRLRDIMDVGAPVLAPIDLTQAVRHAMVLTAAQWKGRIGLEFTPANVPTVQGNEQAVVRAIMALLLNAFDALQVAAGAQRRIDIATRVTPDGHPSVEVRDTGPGIPDEVIAHLGEPFFNHGDRLGLGLYAVHRIMHAHGGQLIAGNLPSGGALVSLIFPLQPIDRLLAVGRAFPVASQSAAASPATILVVDDEPLVRQAFARVLERAGHHVLRAGDGQDALRQMHSDIVDVVITDLMMPNMSGVELAHVMATSHPALRERLIVVSGGAVTNDAVEFVATAGLCVLNKPVSPSDLLAAVNAALDGRAATARTAAGADERRRAVADALSATERRVFPRP